MSHYSVFNYSILGDAALVARLAFGFLAAGLPFYFFAWIFRVRKLSLFAKAIKRCLINIFATSVAETDGGSGKI